MKKQKLLGIGLITILVIGIVFVSGCTGKAKQSEGTAEQSEETTEPASESEDTSVLNTCTELNGHICSVGDDCIGEWLDASDTFSCCSKTCSTATGEEILDISPFEETPENEELGDLT